MLILPGLTKSANLQEGNEVYVHGQDKMETIHEGSLQTDPERQKGQVEKNKKS